ncbi:Ferredoxin-thioredoxin reductase variable chain [Nymphaea thermarum]|nr:Ferredoxin-thioredoxin reductase variable chain [Nymphaea thermarum]
MFPTVSCCSQSLLPPPTLNSCSHSYSSWSSAAPRLHDIPASATSTSRRSSRAGRGAMGVVCEVNLKQDLSTTLGEGQDDKGGGTKIGARVRVTVPLKVYHVPKVAELDLNGMEGEIKDNVSIWKGKHISANLPYKVQFAAQVGDRSIKFFAHLREDEFEYIQQ